VGRHREKRVAVDILVVNSAVISLSTFSTAVLKSNRVYLSDSVTDPLTGVLNRRRRSPVPRQTRRIQPHMPRAPYTRSARSLK